MNTAEQALSVYKTSSTFSNLQKAELGIYGLASANGLSEYITGKDMFGNEQTDVQRQSSLYNSILGASLVASPFVPSLVKNGKLVKEETIKQMHKLATKTKSGALYVYDEVRGGMQVLFGNQNMNFAYAGAGGVKPILSNVMNSKEVRNRIEETISRFSFARGTVYTVSDYLDDIIVNGKVDSAKMNKLKNAIQNNRFSVDEISEISKIMSELGITKEYNEALMKIDFGKYLRKLVGDPPAGMINPHAHHILFKKGLGEAQQQLVQEGQELLRRYGIDPIIGKENLVWAPNAVIGQHSLGALENVVNHLKTVEAEGGDFEDIVEALEELGVLASRR
ncbi:AHH domain-containing protein [Bacillus sp. J37]|uniref:AHH domain-containing protein n=1 Tax=Bacillus sp. J37 TaxID=935837 RepID=UPI0004B780D2|nr:AHH domain-containing protein [Bacillus sp. J37]